MEQSKSHNRKYGDDNRLQQRSARLRVQNYICICTQRKNFNQMDARKTYEK